MHQSCCPTCGKTWSVMRCSQCCTHVGCNMLSTIHPFGTPWWQSNSDPMRVHGICVELWGTNHAVKDVAIHGQWWDLCRMAICCQPSIPFARHGTMLAGNTYPMRVYGTCVWFLGDQPCYQTCGNPWSLVRYLQYGTHGGCNMLPASHAFDTPWWHVGKQPLPQEGLWDLCGA
jgi:hypothetical protein